MARLDVEWSCWPSGSTATTSKSRGSFARPSRPASVFSKATPRMRSGVRLDLGTPRRRAERENARIGWPVLLDAALSLGRLDEVAELTELLGQRPPGHVPPFLRAQLQRGLGLLAAARGEHDVVEAHLTDAVERFRGLGYPYWLARARPTSPPGSTSRRFRTGEAARTVRGGRRDARAARRGAGAGTGAGAARAPISCGERLRAGRGVRRRDTGRARSSQRRPRQRPAGRTAHARAAGRARGGRRRRAGARPWRCHRPAQPAGRQGDRRARRDLRGDADRAGLGARPLRAPPAYGSTRTHS